MPDTTVPSPNTFPTLGILGGGQLGRMTALAAIRMGLRVRFLADKQAGPMEGLGEVFVDDWHDPDVLRRFATGCAVVTVESEWAPADHLAQVLPEGTALWPAPRTLHLIRDKGLQKRTMVEAGLPVPDFVCCPTLEAAQAAAASFGFPVLLKRYRGSYDGYGNATVRTPDELAAAWARLALEDGLLVEAWVPFVRELAVLVARRPDGEKVVYPVAYTEQRNHRCHAVVVPAQISEAVQQRAQEIALGAVHAVGGVGITAVELFELADGTVLVNELAPRPHNTGHYSIEGCYASQFENHVRAILGWPLGSPALRTPVAVMVNIIGQRDGIPETPHLLAALASPEISVHVYGKQAVRKKRKMGHLTVTGTDAEATRRLAEEAAAHLIL